MATDLSQYDPIFQAAGQEWNVNPTLLKAVAGQESGGDLNAVSSKGAQGLMQITPDTQKYLGITDPKDPTQQIYGAAKYLDEGLNREGSPEGALLYYHGGPGWRQAYGPESQAYVPAVTARYAALSQAQASAAPPAPSGASQGATPVIVGDSLASPGGLGGSGVVGAVPGAIRSSVAADARKGTYQGQNVVLSSGASNAPGDMTNVEGQLQLLQNGGAKGVTLLGVGPGIETKAPGTNDALQGLATKYGATFVPLPADQMSKDGVHPTAQGYKALRTQLASATPTTATDATPASAAATGPGNAMASDDPLSLLPPAPQPAAGGGSATSTAPDEVHPLSLLPPAPQQAGAQATAAATQQGAPGGPSINESGGQYSPAGSASAANLGIPGVPDPARPAVAPQPEPNALQMSVGRLGSALSSGWQSSVLAPGAEATVESLPYVGNALGYLSRGLGAVGAGAGQAFQEAQRGVSAAGGLIDPALGRDLAIGLPVAATFAGMPEVASLRAPIAAQLADTRAANAAPLSPAFRDAPVAPEATARMAGREPGATEPSGVSGASQPPNPNVPLSVNSAPQPESVGAAATSDQNATGGGQPTRGAILRNLENTVNQSAEDRLNPQGVDNTAYVDGIPTRLLASRDFSTTGNALDEKVARGEDTPFRDELDTNTRDRNTGMVDLLRRNAGDANLLDQAVEARKEAAPDNFGAFDGEHPVDASGLLKAVDDALGSPSAKRGAIKSALADVRSSLFDQDGNLETMPSTIYGARQNLTDLLDRSKGIGDEAKKLQAATAILEKMRPTFDETIQAGAPNYANYMAEYQRLSQPIDQMRFLQQYTEGTTGKKVTGSDGYLIPNRVQSMLNDVLQGQKQRGPHPAQSLTDQQIQDVVNVRNELAAVQLKDRNASVKGSDTFQQLRRSAQGPGPLQAAARETAGVAGNVLAWHLAQTPELNAAIAGIQHGVMPVVRATRQAQRQANLNALVAARRQELLTPGPPNALAP